MEWIYWLLLIIAAGGCLLLTLLGLPGLWLMLILAVGYGWATGWETIGPWTVGVLVLLAAVAEVIDSLASAFGAQRAGASKRAMVLSVIGAIVGSIVLTGLIPIPVIGTVVGLCVGAFAGAMLGELFKGRDHGQAVKSGLGAMAGRLAGMLAKLGIGGVMLVIVVLMALPAWHPAPAPPPAGMGTTQPVNVER